MPSLPNVLLGPRHLHMKVRTPQDYIRRQREHIDRGKSLYPGLLWPDPWLALVSPPVIVSEGHWKVVCQSPACLVSRECPLLDLDWRMALCFACGAIYRDVVVPAEAGDVERILLLRSEPRTRNWNWPFPESVEDLIAQNRMQGEAA